MDRWCYHTMEENRKYYTPRCQLKMAWPTKKQLEEAEHLFKEYIFFKKARGHRELTTTCCGKSVTWDVQQRAEDDVTRAISYGKHNDEVVCPFCGRKIQLKDESRLGKRKNLKEYHAVLFLREKAGDIYAVAAWACKDYKNELNEKPIYKITYMYHFSIGEVKAEYNYCGVMKVNTLKGSYNPSVNTISEPFSYGSYYWPSYEPYNIIGFSEIQKSNMRYCQYREWSGNWGVSLHARFIKYLTAYCMYPLNIEMLIKMGKREVVDDLIYCRKKNSSIIKWGESDPCKAFNLTKSEFRIFIKNNISIETLGTYKKLKKIDKKTTFEYAEELNRSLCAETKTLLSICRKYKITTVRAINYLNRFTGPRCHGAHFGIRQAVPIWKDYIDMAKYLGYDMKNEVVIMPKNLEQAHNEAAAEQTRRLELQKAEENKKKYAKMRRKYKERNKKYNFELGELCIFVAPTFKSVVAEGKALSHCVGGYAARHMECKTTILFLRKKSHPDVSYVTVEMQGNRIVQAHGYKNEREGDGTAPRDRHKAFFDKWLAWIKAGSKRAEDGTPIISQKQKKKGKEVA